MHALVATVLLWLTGLDKFWQDTEAYPHAESLDNRASVVVANGTPLSVRMRLGRPYSLNKRVNIGLASSTAVELSAWQLNR